MLRVIRVCLICNKRTWTVLSIGGVLIILRCAELLQSAAQSKKYQQKTPLRWATTSRRRWSHYFGWAVSIGFGVSQPPNTPASLEMNRPILDDTSANGIKDDLSAGVPLVLIAPAVWPWWFFALETCVSAVNFTAKWAADDFLFNVHATIVYILPSDEV